MKIINSKQFIKAVLNGRSFSKAAAETDLNVSYFSAYWSGKDARLKTVLQICEGLGYELHLVKKEGENVLEAPKAAK